MSDARLIRIPLAFLRDHESRDLDTPELVRIAPNGRVGWIRADDPALPELVDDARHYAATGMGWDPWVARTIVPAARTLLRAIEATDA